MKKDNELKEIMKKYWSYQPVRIASYITIALTLTYASGFVFRLIGKTAAEYKNMQRAIKS